jgi:hypothetical protein
MQKLTPRISNSNTKSNSPILPGNNMSLKAFKAWISAAESQPTVGINEIKSTWAQKKKQLKKLMR